MKVQNNIAKFGGDPDNVTAFGESAGGFLLAHIMLSQDKLFRRVILQSGFANTLPVISWAVHEENYQELLKKASITGNSASERLKALRELPINELIEYSSRSINNIGFAPENPMSTKAIWTDQNTLSRLKEGHWNPYIESIIMGVCKDEGSLFSHMTQSHTLGGYEFARKEFLSSVPKEKLNTVYDGHIYTKHDTKVEKYLDLTLCPGSQEIGDKLFKVPMELMLSALDLAKNFKTQQPLSIYVYALNATAPELLKPSGGISVTPHTIDIPLLFNMKWAWTPDCESAKTSANLGGSWYNFAKSGCPDLCWPAYDSHVSPYKRVFQQNGKCPVQDVREKTKDEMTRIKFWSEIIDPFDFGAPDLIEIVDVSSPTDSSEHHDDKNQESIVV